MEIKIIIDEIWLVLKDLFDDKVFGIYGFFVEFFKKNWWNNWI